MALPADASGTPAHWLVYVGTPNVDATCAQAQGLGARICKAATDIPNVGRFAVLADPQGATFAVFTPSGGPPPGAPPQQGAFSWHELQTTDVAAALRFYGQLFGWSKGVGHDMGAMGVYQLFEHGGAGVGGICNTQGPSTPPSWLSYVHVADANRAVASAKAAGGRLLHGPIEVPGGSWIALFLDPQGGAFAVQEAPRTMSAPKLCGHIESDAGNDPRETARREGGDESGQAREGCEEEGGTEEKDSEEKGGAQESQGRQAQGRAQEGRAQECTAREVRRSAPAPSAAAGASKA